MVTTALDLTILCMCGQPANAPVHGDGGHMYHPVRGADQVRDDQYIDKGRRGGHYRVKQQRVFQLPKPALGADFLVTVPAVNQWVIVSLLAQLVTDAVVNNRVPHLVIKDALGNAVYNVPATNNQTAGSTKNYSGGAAIAPSDFDLASVLVLPYGLKMLQGWTIGSLTTNLDAGDQWQNVNVLVKEWLDF